MGYLLAHVLSNRFKAGSPGPILSFPIIFSKALNKAKRLTGFDRTC